MNLVISKCVTAVKVSNFSGHYLRNRSTLEICVLSYIGIVQHKEHSPEVLSIPPGTSCIYGQATKSRQRWIGGAEETQYSSVMETGLEGVEWINLAQDKDRRQPLVDKEWILSLH